MTKKEIKEKLEKLSNKSNEIFNEIYELTEKLEKIKIKESLEQGDFLEGSWQLIFDGSRLKLKGNTYTFVQLSKNLQDDFHTSLNINKNVTIHFSDEDIYIVADSEEELYEFTSENKLNIDINSALNTLERIEKYDKNILQEQH